MNNDLLYQIALTLVPHIGNIQAKALLDIYGDARSVFSAKKKDLEKIDGIGTVRAKSVKDFNDFSSSENEINFIEKNNILPLFITEHSYPKRLLNCYDSPLLLYYKGNADLNAVKIIAVVGTRNNSLYGKWICETLIEELQTENILVVSGLALGIDTIAHKAALKNNLSTIAVLAHGLHTVYPSQNITLARQIIEQGGLLTELTSSAYPDKQNFPRRNRIVAGMCDAIVVIESGRKGGSLITADLGNEYNKDVFAFPGRINDSKSQGCNYLIQSNKAALLTNTKDLLEILGWMNQPKQESRNKQYELFIDFTDHEKIIVDILKQQPAQIDELSGKSGLSSSSLAATLLSLEMKNAICSLPGKIYRLV